VRKRLASDHVQVVEGTLQQVVPAQAGVGLLFSDGEVLKLDALYVGFGVRVRSALARDLGARCDESGYVEVDARQQSSVPGLYAAGGRGAVALADLGCVRPGGDRRERHQRFSQRGALAGLVSGAPIATGRTG
jgi:pyruvate/2-oxoglutarate dehydrogenase complex dihydrolipoamide dehydrogenase (E3) component